MLTEDGMLAMLSSWSNGTTVVPTETFQSRRTSRGDQPTPAIHPPSPTPSLRSSTPFTRSPAQSPDSQSHRTFLFFFLPHATAQYLLRTMWSPNFLIPARTWSDNWLIAFYARLRPPRSSSATQCSEHHVMKCVPRSTPKSITFGGM